MTRKYEELHQRYEELYELGHYREALQIAEAAVDVARSAAQQRPGRYAMSLHNLATLHRLQGAYDKAEPLFLESLNIWVWLFGEEDPDCANSYMALGVLYESMGDYEKSEPLLLKARAILANASNEQPSEHCVSLHLTSLQSLASLYESMGAYEKAESLYREATEIGARTLGEENAFYASTLNSLGAMYLRKGDYYEAERLFLQARKIEAGALGEEHPSYATTLGNLAMLYAEIGAYEKSTRRGKLPMCFSRRFTKIEAVHKGLARYVSGFGASRRSLQVDTDAVREALPHEAALVEYLRFAPLVAGGLTSQSKAQEDR